MNKFEVVREIISNHMGENLTLLDVGCRNCELKQYVKHLVQYSGMDLLQNAQGSVDFVLDVEKGLPMQDSSYDFLVALDLLEHLNDFQAGIEELLRVARRYLIVMLPNLAYAPLRLEFFLHGSFSGKTGKYNLKYSPGRKSSDRHRWLTVLPQIDTYMQQLAQDKNITIEIVWFYGSKKRAFFAKISKLTGLASSWWVPSSLYILEKSANTL